MKLNPLLKLLKKWRKFKPKLCQYVQTIAILPLRYFLKSKKFLKKMYFKLKLEVKN